MKITTYKPKEADLKKLELHLKEIEKLRNESNEWENRTLP
jgi:hypothetical protein